MSLLAFALTLAIIGVIWYLLYTYVPMPEVFKTVLNIVAVVVAIFLVLALFGIMPLPFSLK